MNFKFIQFLLKINTNFIINFTERHMFKIYELCEEGEFMSWENHNFKIYF